MSKRHAGELPAVSGWLTVSALVAVAVVMVLPRSSRPPDAPDRVTVVSGRSASPAPRRSVSSIPAQPAPAAASSPGIATAHLLAAYPFLQNTSLRCAGDVCHLDAVVYPMEAQADLDKRQEMLLGGLAATLARDGYVMAAPFGMAEIDSNVFHITATLEPGHGQDDGGSAMPASSSRAAAMSAANAGKA